MCWWWWGGGWPTPGAHSLRKGAARVERQVEGERFSLLTGGASRCAWALNRRTRGHGVAPKQPPQCPRNSTLRGFSCASPLSSAARCLGSVAGPPRDAPVRHRARARQGAADDQKSPKGMPRRPHDGKKGLRGRQCSPRPGRRRHRPRRGTWSRSTCHHGREIHSNGLAICWDPCRGRRGARDVDRHAGHAARYSRRQKIAFTSTARRRNLGR